MYWARAGFKRPSKACTTILPACWCIGKRMRSLLQSFFILFYCFAAKDWCSICFRLYHNTRFIIPLMLSNSNSVILLLLP